MLLVIMLVVFATIGIASYLHVPAGEGLSTMVEAEPPSKRQKSHTMNDGIYSKEYQIEHEGPITKLTAKQQFEEDHLRNSFQTARII